MLTEAKAQSGWCPWKVPERLTIEAHDAEEHLPRCDGGRCAMWRWFDPFAEYGYCALATDEAILGELAVAGAALRHGAFNDLSPDIRARAYDANLRAAQYVRYARPKL